VPESPAIAVDVEEASRLLDEGTTAATAGELHDPGAGDAIHTQPGHDGWVVGNEPYVGADVTGTEFAQTR
jgi:hypothetical protein